MKKDHFEGKSVLDHLKTARTKGAFANAELHGKDVISPVFAASDGAMETAVILFFLSIVFPLNYKMLLIFSFGFFLWKTARSALLGWGRLERLHRVAKEEMWEIQHNREQEKEELLALYEAKGLKGRLLEETVTVLMAEDNRLLWLMLEEELGLSLENYDHPLRQALWVGCGVFLSAVMFIGGYLFSFWGSCVVAAIIVFITAFIITKEQKNRVLEGSVWTISSAACVAGIVYFLKQI
jgi:vacuolar iron transporter family protein